MFNEVRMKRRTFLKSAAAGAVVAAAPLPLLASRGPEIEKPVGYLYAFTQKVDCTAFCYRQMNAYPLMKEGEKDKPPGYTGYVSDLLESDILIYSNGLLRVKLHVPNGHMGLMDIIPTPTFWKGETVVTAVFTKKRFDAVQLSYTYQVAGRKGISAVWGLGNAKWLKDPVAVCEKERKLLYHLNTIRVGC